MMYYIIDKSDEEKAKIIFADEDLDRLKNTIPFLPDYTEEDIIECEEGQTVYKFKLMTEDEKEAVQAKEEQDRINGLFITKLDFVRGLKLLGVTSAEIKAYLEANEDVSDALTYCSNVYCGVVRQLCPITVNENLEITDEQIVKIFKDKCDNTEE